MMSYPALTEKPTVGGADRAGPDGAAALSNGTADGAANGAMGLLYGALVPGGDDTEPKEKGGAEECMGGKVEVKATGGRGLEKTPGAKLETPAGLGCVSGLEIPEHKKNHINETTTTS